MTLLDGRWVTDGGLETDFIFNRGFDLPEFASFPLLDDDAGRAGLRDYYTEYARIAERADAGVVVETPTWRASPDWAERVGYSGEAVDRVNQEAVAFTRGVLEAASVPRIAVSGSIGPRGDGYVADQVTDAEEAASYHAPQVASFARAGADLVHAMTMTHVDEAVGVVWAARHAGIPVAVSFTVETDGTLPDGTALSEAMAAMEERAPADHYGVNCAHPLHVHEAVSDASWQDRVTFFRPNASTLSHAELDEAEEIDIGDIDLLVSSTASLRRALPNTSVIGGCCGTDARHVAALWGVPLRD